MLLITVRTTQLQPPKNQDMNTTTRNGLPRKTPTYKASDTYQDLLAYPSVLWCSRQVPRCMRLLIVTAEYRAWSSLRFSLQSRVEVGAYIAGACMRGMT